MILVKCTSQDKAFCPRCGSRNVLAIGKKECHCGQCGTEISVEITASVNKKEKDEYQMSIFD